VNFTDGLFASFRDKRVTVLSCISVAAAPENNADDERFVRTARDRGRKEIVSDPFLLQQS